MTLDDHFLKREPETDPAAIYRWRDGIYAVELLVAAITELDLFTALSGKPLDRNGVARLLGIAERPADVMLTLFSAMGLLIVRAGKLLPSPQAEEHLVRSSPWYLGPYYSSLKDRPLVKSMVEVLRTGKPAAWTTEEERWERAMENPEFAERFTADMDCRGLYLGPRLARRLSGEGHSRLLDIGGGSGVYACSILARQPHLRAAVLEKPPVDGIARRLIKQRGLADRAEVIAGDMFQGPLPGGFDLHLYSNVLHDWNEDQVGRLLRGSFESLAPGGTIAIHDAHLDRQKTGPLPVAEYSVLLMHFTEGRCYSVKEVEDMLAEAGFTEPHLLETGAGRSVITARKQPRK